MIEENNLLPEFAKHNLGEKDIIFIEEQIAGPKHYNIHQVIYYLSIGSFKSLHIF